jgi:hypothetical protein
MRAYQLLEFVPQQIGTRWNTTPNAEKLQWNYPSTIDKYIAQIEFVATKLGDKRVGELETLATALYVTLENPVKGEQELAERIHELKPHVAVEDARIAL